MCHSCRHGLRDHCLDPGDGEEREEVIWLEPDREVDLGAWSRVLVAADLLQHSGRGSARVALIGSGNGLELTRATLAASGVDVRAADTSDVQGDSREDVRRVAAGLRFGDGAEGRPPDIVLAVDGDLGLSARLVRRGGAIGALGDVTTRVSMSALVQRELEVLMTRDVSSTAATSPLCRVIAGAERAARPGHGG